MIKGVNHTIIEVTNPCNQYFERALLFVRPQAEEIKNQHLQKEADFFVDTIGKPLSYNNLTITQQKKNAKIKRIIFHSLWWCVGVACGILIHIAI